MTAYGRPFKILIHVHNNNLVHFRILLVNTDVLLLLHANHAFSPHSESAQQTKHFFYLPSHDQTRGFVADLVDHSSVSSTQLTYGVKILILQLPNLSFLGEKGFQSFPLLLVQVQLTQFLLQGLEVGSVRRRQLVQQGLIHRQEHLTTPLKWWSMGAKFYSSSEHRKQLCTFSL